MKRTNYFPMGSEYRLLCACRLDLGRYKQTLSPHDGAVRKIDTTSGHQEKRSERARCGTEQQRQIDYSEPI